MTDRSSPVFEELAQAPKDVGWMLLLAGLASEVGMPGVPPFWMAGMLILWPETGEILARPMQRRFPAACGRTQTMIKRYLTDLETRYPRKSGATDG